MSGDEGMVVLKKNVWSFSWLRLCLVEERSRRFEEKRKYHVDMDPNLSLFLIFLLCFW